MSDQTIFNEEPIIQEDNPTNVNDVFADKLKAIVNDNGEQKYKSLDDALDALNHSQQFIKTLKGEKTDIEEKYQDALTELEKRQSVEEVVNKLINRNQSNDGPKPAPNADPQKASDLSEDKVAEIVANLLNSQKMTDTQESNYNKVASKLVETYGDKTREVIQAKAKELDMSPQEMEQLAKTKPNVVLRLFSDVAPPVSNRPSQTSAAFPTTPKEQEIKFDRSLVRGGVSNKELADAMKQFKERTYKRLGVEP
jgi:hypothetical protein